MKIAKSILVGATLGTAMVAGSAAQADAQVEYGAGNQGSLLIFPFLTDDLNRTTVKIANSGDSVDVKLVRVCWGVKNGIAGDDICHKLDSQIFLSPKDTHTFRVGPELGTGRFGTDPRCNYGYVVAYAIDSSERAIKHNHLYGQVQIEQFKNGKGLGATNAIAIKRVSTDLEEPGRLTFDGTKYETVSQKLKAIIRQGSSESRTSKVLIGTLDILAGGQNEATKLNYKRYDDDENDVSGNIEYVCSVLVDAKDVFQLRPGGSPNNMNTLYGTLELEADSSTPNGLFGIVIREEGALKRHVTSMWQNDDSTTSTTFCDGCNAGGPVAQ